MQATALTFSLVELTRIPSESRSTPAAAGADMDKSIRVRVSHVVEAISASLFDRDAACGSPSASSSSA